ncbi:FecR family protein [Sphingomonas colocasiae]|uniref:FecR domain-containing protein n=1 Tax=Sphingomonas colocasiae TaxID=1848973 RepID=A0ABS7PWT6_9SPHN|nr:FecR domain-containing protein [Sphingomonas colocasiae]MBY8825601.1 FecR domain-containing protein [Sphingomonas colocasiae]
MVNGPDTGWTPDPETRAEAAIWVARLHSDTRTAQDDAAFRAWLQEKPDNAHVFDRMTATWDMAGAISPFEIEAAPARRRPSRRALFAGLGGAVATALGFGAWNAAYAGVLETGIGERREFMLDDGSRIMLDTDTRVRVRMGDRSRHVSLERGRIGLTISVDTARPFQVEAADRVVTAASGLIDVRCEGASVAVAVVKGTAKVGSAGAQAIDAAAMLVTGQRLTAVSAQPTRIDEPDVRKVTSWQNGQAVFEGNTLAQAAAEMNRYSTMRIEFADPAAAAMRISGVYEVGDTAAFADSVAVALPVRVRRDGSRLIVASAPRDDSR